MPLLHIFQATHVRFVLLSRIGSRVPGPYVVMDTHPMGASFAYTGPHIAIAAKGNMPAVLSAT